MLISYDVKVFVDLCLCKARTAMINILSCYIIFLDSHVWLCHKMDTYGFDQVFTNLVAKFWFGLNTTHRI